jgi:hypothetical protein
MEDKWMLADIEKIFGKPTQMCLFSEDEESYNIFRQSIIDAPSYSYDRAKLPFDDGVKITLKVKQIHLDLLYDVSYTLFRQIINPLINYKRIFSENRKYSTIHLFRLYVKDVCNAYGYYDYTANHFYIKKGSMFAKGASIVSSSAASSATRNRMIAKSCTDMGNYYIVDDDFKCRTATSAASILMGKVSHYSYWLDENRKGLADIYPSRFTNKKK